MGFSKKTVRDSDVDGKRVLLRAPLNVPLKDGVVTDDLRLRSIVPTLLYMLDHKASVVLVSHHSDETASLRPVAQALEKILGKPVLFLGDVLDTGVHRAVHALEPGQVGVLENIRFHPEEKKNDEMFAKALAELADMYVDDDFTTMHRAHASTVGVTKFLPSVAGFTVENEVQTITDALEDPTRPLVAIIGGAKVSTKTELLKNLLPKVDVIFVGGAMANTFFAAKGLPVGKSLQESDQHALAKEIMHDAEDKGVTFLLPDEVVVTTDLKSAAHVRTVAVKEVGPEDIIADIGPAAVKALEPWLAKKGTVIWNGPLGITETPAFAEGSKALAHAIIDSGATSIIGGGDTAAFVDAEELHDDFGFVSTGGGASLELMSGGRLPGLEALEDES